LSRTHINGIAELHQVIYKNILSLQVGKNEDFLTLRVFFAPFVRKPVAGPVKVMWRGPGITKNPAVGGIRQNELSGNCASQAAFRTLPDFMQFVQTVIRWTLPSTIARTFCRFGWNRRGDLLCA
jgi:hypothetical protein